MKYLKLFQSNESANNFAINDIPFVGFVNDPSWGGTVAACKEDGMKIAIEGGQVVVEGAAVILTFTADGEEYQFEQGMTWGEWLESDYNIHNWFISSGSEYVCNGYDLLYKRTAISTSDMYTFSNALITDSDYFFATYTGGSND